MTVKKPKPKNVDKPKSEEPVVVYDGALGCKTCRSKRCPKAVLQTNGTVRIFDPHKLQSGSFTMSVEEWNALLENAKPIE